MSSDRQIYTALDVEDIQNHPRGQKVINGLASTKGHRLYRTARGRLAVQMQPDQVARLQAVFKFELQDGLDGTKIVVLPSLPAAAVVAAEPSEAA